MRFLPKRLSREIVILIGILALGFLLRAFYLSEIVKNPDFANPGLDAAYHNHWARGLVTGDWSPPAGYADPMIRSTPYFRPPGYPYFLALLYLLTGSSYLWARIAQMLLGLVSVFLAFRLSRKWFGDSLGLIVAGLMAIYWVFIYFEGELLEPAFLVPLALLLVYELSLWTEEINLRRSLVTGLILGLCALVRPNVLLFGPVILGWALWILLRRNDRPRFRVAAVGLILGAVIAIAPATIRNCIVGRDCVLISANAGINLFFGNNESANGVTPAAPGIPHWDSTDYPRIVKELEKKLGRPLKYSDASAYFGREAARYIKAHPVSVLRLTARKTLLFWGPKEVSNEKEDELERAHSRVLRNIPGNFALLLSLAVLGAVLLLLDTRRRGKQEEASSVDTRRQYEVSILILLFVATYFASYLLFFVAGRYRVPIIPFLMLFGAYGLDRAARFAVSRDFRRTGFFLLMLVAVYALASRNFAGYEPDRAKWHFGRGVDYGLVGETDLAIREYSEAVRIKPDFSQAETNLGLTLLDNGEVDKAVDHLSKSLKINPDDRWARYGMARALGQRGKLDEAIKAYREVTRMDPGNLMAHYELGLILLAKGSAVAAASHFSDALRIKPDFAAAHAGLGVAAEGQGRLDQAAAHYSKALSINPEAILHYRLGSVLARQGKLDKAVPQFRNAVRMFPDYAAAHYDLGVALSMQGKLDEAIKHYSEAIRSRPDYTKAHMNLAMALYSRGRYAEAWKEVRLCRKYGGALDPEFLRALSSKMPEPKQ